MDTSYGFEAEQCTNFAKFIHARAAQRERKHPGDRSPVRCDSCVTGTESMHATHANPIAYGLKWNSCPAIVRIMREHARGPQQSASRIQQTIPCRGACVKVWQPHSQFHFYIFCKSTGSISVRTLLHDLQEHRDH